MFVDGTKTRAIRFLRHRYFSSLVIILMILPPFSLENRPPNISLPQCNSQSREFLVDIRLFGEIPKLLSFGPTSRHDYSTVGLIPSPCELEQFDTSGCHLCY